MFLCFMSFVMGSIFFSYVIDDTDEFYIGVVEFVNDLDKLEMFIENMY